MDMVELLTETLSALELTFEFDRLNESFILNFHEEKTGRYAIIIQALSGAAQLRARFLAGESDTFNPALAARAAILTYELDLQIGADPRDGEIEARLRVDLIAVEPAVRGRMLQRTIKRFLKNQSLARAILQQDGREDPQSPRFPDLLALRDIQPSA